MVAATAASVALLDAHRNERERLNRVDAQWSEVEEARAWAARASPIIHLEQQQRPPSPLPSPPPQPQPHPSPGRRSGHSSHTESILRISRPLRRTASAERSDGSPVAPVVLARSPRSHAARTTAALPPLHQQNGLPPRPTSAEPAPQLQRILSRYSAQSVQGSATPVPPLSTFTSVSPADFNPIFSGSNATAPAASPLFFPLPPPASVSQLPDDAESLREHFHAAQHHLSSVQHELADHIEANSTLTIEYQKLEFENSHLHECLSQRNAMIIKLEETNQSHTKQIEELKAKLAAAALVKPEELRQLQERLAASEQRNVQLQSQLDTLQPQYDAKLQHILELSQRELATQRQQDLGSLRARYEQVTERMAERLEDGARLKRVLWRQVQSKREGIARLVHGEMSPPPPAVAMAALASKSPSLSAPQLLLKSLLFQSWCLRIHERLASGRPDATRRTQLLGRVFRRLEHLSAWHAFRTWKTFADNQAMMVLHAHLTHQKRARITLLINKWRLNGVSSCFAAWRSWSHARHARRKQVLHKIVHRLENLQLFRALRSWHHVLESEKMARITDQLTAQKTARVKILIAKWRLSSQTPYFLGWRAFVRSKRARKREVLTRVFKRLENLAAYRALRHWRHTVEAAATRSLQEQIGQHKLKRVAALIARWRLSSQTPYFLSWRSYTRETRARKRTLLSKVVRRLEHLQEHRVMRQWQLQVQYDKQQELKAHMQATLGVEKQKRVAALIHRWRLSSLAPSFVSWARFARETRARRRVLLEKILLRLGNLQLFSGWRTWVAFTRASAVSHMQARFAAHTAGLEAELARQKQARVKALIESWRRRGLTPIVTAWRTYARETRLRKRELLGRVITRMAHSSLWRAYRTWMAFVDRVKQASFAAQIGEQKKKRVAALIQRWRLSSTTPCFQAWRTYARTARLRKRQLMEKILRRMESAPLPRALRQWKLQIESQKVHALRAALTTHKRARAYAAITAWRTRCIIPAFTSWREWARARRTRKRQLLSGVITKLAYNNIWKAFRQWRHYSEHTASTQLQRSMQAQNAHLSEQLQAQKRKRYEKMLAKWAAKSPREVLRAWQTVARASRVRRQTLLQKVLDRMANSEMYRAWRSWTQFVEASKVHGITSALQGQLNALKAKQIKALVERWRNRTAVPCFQAWRIYTRDTRARKKELLDKILKRLSNLQLFSGWRTWVAFTRASAVSHMQARFAAHTAGLEAELARQKQARVKALIQRWRMSSLTPSFAAWRTTARASRARKTVLLSKVLHRLAHKELWRSWRAWMQYVESSKVHALQQQFEAQTSGLLDAHTAQLLALKKKRVQQLIESWRLRGLTPIFLAWRQTAHTGKMRKRELLDKMCRRLLNRELHAGFRSWLQWLEDSKLHALRSALNSEKTKRVKALIVKWNRSTSIPVFQAWARYTRQTRTDRQKVAERRRDILDKSLRRMVHLSKYQCMRSWLAFVDGCKLRDLQSRLSAQKDSKIALAARILQRWTSQSNKDVFRAWRSHASTQRQTRKESQERRQCVLSKMIARLASSSAWKALRQWQQFVLAQRTNALNGSVKQYALTTAQMQSENDELRRRLQELSLTVAYLQRVVLYNGDE